MHIFICGRTLINYLIVGNGEATIVFLHGWGGSIDSFIGLARRLSCKYRCILVDFAGFGKTVEPCRPYYLKDYTNDLDALLGGLNVKECFFVAHSFGGRVAIDYLSKLRCAKVRGLVLIDSAGMKPRRTMKYYTKVMTYKLRKRLHLNVSQYGSSDYRALSGNMQATFVNIVNEYLDNKLYNIHIPTLIMWGDKDRETPLYMAKRLKRRIKGSALIVMRGRGHFAYIEEEYRCYKIIDAFIGGLC